MTADQVKINLDIAWRTHAAQENWAAKADTKASILLALDGAVIATIVGARAQAGSFVAVLNGGREWTLVAALVVCAASASLAAAVILPMLGRTRSAGTIYFGDLRRRRADEVAHQLAGMTMEDQLSQVSSQLVAMARATWLKHRLLQAAIAATLVGYLTIIVVLLV